MHAGRRMLCHVCERRRAERVGGFWTPQRLVRVCSQECWEVVRARELERVGLTPTVNDLHTKQQ